VVAVGNRKEHTPHHKHFMDSRHDDWDFHHCTETVSDEKKEDEERRRRGRASSGREGTSIERHEALTHQLASAID